MKEQLMGWRRANGKIGIRNHVLVIPASVCATVCAQRIAASTEGVVFLDNQHGCCQIGLDFTLTERTLIGFGIHPNVSSVLIVGLGCEGISTQHIAAEMEKSGKPVRFLIIQEEGGTLKTQEKGIAIVREFAQRAASEPQEPFSVDEIILGLECGSSDTTSGLCANPALGVASDALIGAGGTALLSETTELIGAEHILAKRATSPQTAQKLLDIVAQCEAKSMTMGVDLRGSQPTPGNIAGGITTIEEKSLGCIHKAGSAPVSGVLEYAELINGSGLFVMDTPGQDVESITGMVAGGVQVMVFTTGRGTPVGCPIIPVIKVTGNPNTAVSMKDHIDVNAGLVMTGEANIQQMGARIFNEILDVCAGKQTCAEMLGHHEFGIYKVMSSF